MAAQRGANVVAVARNEIALCELVDEINAAGGSAIYAIADVADEEALKRAAEPARQQFGGIDTLARFKSKLVDRFESLIAGLPDVLAGLVDVSRPAIDANSRDAVDKRSSGIKWQRENHLPLFVNEVWQQSAPLIL